MSHVQPFPAIVLNCATLKIPPFSLLCSAPTNMFMIKFLRNETSETVSRSVVCILVYKCCSLSSNVFDCLLSVNSRDKHKFLVRLCFGGFFAFLLVSCDMEIYERVGISKHLEHTQLH